MTHTRRRARRRTRRRRSEDWPVYNVFAYLDDELIQKEILSADSPETAIEIVKEVLHGNGFTNTADFTFEVIPIDGDILDVM